MIFVFQVFFNFKTSKCDGTVIDDSKKMKSPMELVLGKQFKLEVWETIVQKMALNEISCFRVDKSVGLLFVILNNVSILVIN